MWNYTIIILLILLTHVSCFPIVRTSEVTSFPNIEKKFDKESTRILVLPIWGKCPSAAVSEYKDKDIVYIFDESLFLTVKDLPNLHKIISTKTSFALLSPIAATGRSIFLDSVIIISETGKMITIDCPKLQFGAVRCQKYNDIGNQNWKNDLIVLLNSKGNTYYQCDSVSKSMGKYPNTCKILYNNKEKQLILDFLKGIEHNSDASF